MPDITRPLLLPLFLLLLSCTVREVCPMASCLDHSYDGVAYKVCYSIADRGLAETECSAMGMRLAILLPETDFQYWQAFLTDNLPVNEFWVGAVFSASDNAYMWDAGGPVRTSYFATDPPDVTGVADGACVMFDVNQVLAHGDCSLNKNFLCQTVFPITNPPPPTTIPPTTQPPTTEAPTTEPPTTQPPTTDPPTTDPPTTDPPTTDPPTTDPPTTDPPTTQVTTQPTTQTTQLSTRDVTTEGPGNASCLCSCVKVIPSDHEERQALIEKEIQGIKRELFVDKTVLSATIRRRVSVEDQRPSARSVGFVGVALLLLAAAIVLAMDLDYLVRLLHNLGQKVKAKAKATDTT